jgi:hypothetical protein
MKELSYIDFVTEIAKDFSLETSKEYKLKLPADNKRIKSFIRGVAHMSKIFDGQIEHPYMLDNKRNEQALSRGMEIRYIGCKSLNDILNESGIKLRSENCKISEGGGWYSDGTRYFYKDFYLEI